MQSINFHDGRNQMFLNCKLLLYICIMKIIFMFSCGDMIDLVEAANIQGVTGGMCETSGECSLGQTIPI